MTKLLDPQLANNKANRKERRRAASTKGSKGAERALASFQRSLEKDLQKTENQERLILKAISDTMPDFIATLNEETLESFFFAIERLATAANRRRIAKHALRPEIVDEMHAEVEEEEARAAEEAEKAEAEAKARKADNAAGQGDSAGAMPKGDAPEGATAP